MQRPETIGVRAQAHNLLLQNGPMSLTDLSVLIGCPKEVLRYAIESAVPFEAMFKKTGDSETIYVAVPIEDVYGGEDFY